MKKTIKIGVLGCSSFAQRSILPAITELNDAFELVGVASRTIQKANSVGLQFRCKAFASYEEIIAAGDLDAIYIPLPTALHFRWIRLALDRGIHVLSEKSLAMTTAEVSQLCDLANRSGLVLLENFQFRFHAQLRRIKQIVAAGEIGSLRCIRTSFGIPPFSDSTNIRYNEQLGGGCLLDLGAYVLKVSQEFMGSEIEVTAASLYHDSVKNVDTWGGGFLQDKTSPLFSEIAFGFDHHYQCSLELWGSKGRLFAGRIFTAPPDLAVSLELSSCEGKQVICVAPDNHFKNMLLHFHDLIQCPSMAQFEHSMNIQQARLIEEFRSVSNGK